jgi:1-acyl-sn-glycerol-3-phosphate acyltransferase
MDKAVPSELPFIPKTTIPFFPIDEHGDVFPSKHKYDFDYENPKKFQWRPKTFWFRFKRFWIRFVGAIVAIPLCNVTYGLKVENRSVWHRHKKELKNGYISICNHVFPWDAIGISGSHYGHFPEFPMWRDGFESTIGPMMRSFGGFPVVKTIHGIAHVWVAMKEVLAEKKWLHVYPEAACWYFYVPIREFLPGTFRLAYETGCPIIPMAYSFRPRRGIFKLWHRKEPLCTLHIGEPLYADQRLPRDEAVAALQAQAHLTIVHLAGIKDEAQNLELKKLYQYTEKVL